MDSTKTIDETNSHVRTRRKGRPASPGSFGGAKAVDPREMGRLGAARRWSPERRDIVHACRELTLDALRTVRAVMLSEMAKDSDRLRAGEIILAYGHGKPAQQIDLSISGPRDVVTLSTAELEAIVVTGQAPFQLEHAGQSIDTKGYEVPAGCVSVANSAEARAGSVPRSVQGGMPRE